MALDASPPHGQLSLHHCFFDWSLSPVTSPHWSPIQGRDPCFGELSLVMGTNVNEKKTSSRKQGMKWDENVVKMGSAMAYPLWTCLLIRKAGAKLPWPVALLELQWKTDDVLYTEASCQLQINYETISCKKRTELSLTLKRWQEMTNVTFKVMMSGFIWGGGGGAVGMGIQRAFD